MNARDQKFGMERFTHQTRVGALTGQQGQPEPDRTGKINYRDPNWRDPAEETGSDIQQNITLFGQHKSVAVHGFVQRSGSAYALRIHNDAVASQEVRQGVMLKLKDGTELTVTRVRPTPDAAWLIASCEVVE